MSSEGIRLSSYTSIVGSPEQQAANEKLIKSCGLEAALTEAGIKSIFLYRTLILRSDETTINSLVRILPDLKECLGRNLATHGYYVLDVLAQSSTAELAASHFIKLYEALEADRKSADTNPQLDKTITELAEAAMLYSFLGMSTPTPNAAPQAAAVTGDKRETELAAGVTSS
jgi:hypothetical protein